MSYLNARPIGTTIKLAASRAKAGLQSNIAHKHCKSVLISFIHAQGTQANTTNTVLHHKSVYHTKSRIMNF